MSEKISLGYNVMDLQLAKAVTEKAAGTVVSLRGDLAQEGVLPMNPCVRKKGSGGFLRPDIWHIDTGLEHIACPMV